MDYCSSTQLIIFLSKLTYLVASAYFPKTLFNLGIKWSTIIEKRDSFTLLFVLSGANKLSDMCTSSYSNQRNARAWTIPTHPKQILYCKKLNYRVLIAPESAILFFRKRLENFSIQKRYDQGYSNPFPLLTSSPLPKSVHC